MTRPSRTRLVLVRHAKSDWRFDGLDDARRPLSRRGLRDCLRYAPRIAPRLPSIGCMLVSPAARTLQTAQALAAALALANERLVIREALYHASPAAMLDEAAEARARGRSGAVALVGHNPGLNDLYNSLAPEPVDNLPTFAVAVLSWPANMRSPPARRCKLELLLTPAAH